MERLKELLDELRSLPAETEWLEFKEAKNNFDFDDLGKYFSALSNEANLKGKPYGWLIFGIENNKKSIVGTQYRSNRANLDKLKSEIAAKTTNHITFIEIHELNLLEGRVIMFQIPAAPQGIPTAWEGHYYGRDDESIGALNIQEIEEIRSQVKNYDWSAQICKKATIADLDPKAIAKAREEYKNKFPRLIAEIERWDDATFLNKAKITINNKITRAAIILLGREESTHFIIPYVVQISWILKDEHNIEKDYEHFGPPFILNAEAVLGKIRNLKYRYLPDNTLFPTEVTQYEPYVIREALHNCIAHQDYELRGRIIVVEKPDELIFTNLGSFIPKSIEAVIEQDAPQSYYRNKFLAEAMVNLNMIDTIGSGIKKMFTFQRERYFPMPDYDLSETDSVKVKITGKILDRNYTQMLMNNTGLSLQTVMYLDKVQKGEKLAEREYRILKMQKLVEGRYPKLFVASKIAAATGDKSSYIKNRAFDDAHYKKMIVAFIKEYGSASRQDIDELLFNKLSDALNEEQKRNKIRNILYAMSKGKVIKNIGSLSKPTWILC